MVKKTVHVVAAKAVLKLFERYIEVLTENMRLQGLPKPTQGRVLGAILTHFLLSQEERIIATHEQAQLVNIREQLKRHFTADELQAFGFPEST